MSTAREAIAEMYALMGEYAAFGASDSEPRAEFAELLHAQLDGRDVDVPRTAREWQLFSDTPGAEAVARTLHAKAQDVMRIANSDHRGFVDAMRYYF